MIQGIPSLRTINRALKNNMTTKGKIVKKVQRKFTKERWQKVQESVMYYRLDTILWFGQYKGWTLREIIESEEPCGAKYVRYLINECDKYLDDEAYAYLERFE